MVISGREPNILRHLDPKEQDRLLAAERRAIARNEIVEQKQFGAWLRKMRKAGRLYYLWPRSDKATTIQVGHWDFTIWLPNGRELRMEFKAPGGKHTAEQEEVSALMGSLGHRVLLITSADEAQRLVELYLNVF